MVINALLLLQRYLIFYQTLNGLLMFSCTCAEVYNSLVGQALRQRAKVEKLFVQKCCIGSELMGVLCLVWKESRIELAYPMTEPVRITTESTELVFVLRICIYKLFKKSFCSASSTFSPAFSM